MLEAADFAVKRPLNEILMRKKRGALKTSSFLENNCVQNTGRNMDSKGHSDYEDCANGPWQKAILVIRWQRMWLNSVYILVFCGR